MVTLMVNVSSELGDEEMVRLLSERSLEVCDRLADVIEDVILSRMGVWDACEVWCEFAEVFVTLRKVSTSVESGS